MIKALSQTCPAGQHPYYTEETFTCVPDVAPPTTPKSIFSDPIVMIGLLFFGVMLIDKMKGIKRF